MNKKIVFFTAVAAVLLVVSGCSSKKGDNNVEAPVNDKPSINTFSVSQEPVKTKKTVVEPAPVVEKVATSVPADIVSSAIVEIKGFAFNPAELTVAVGSTVVWTNSDAISHDIKSASFNSPLLSTGQTFEQKFTTAGVYDYACSIHPSMTGKIIVK